MPPANDEPNAPDERALPCIDKDTAAFSHIPEHGFSLFLANRTKTIHFIRHAEGTHNEANQAHGDDTPCTVGTPHAWNHMDARLTDAGIAQCIKVRDKLLADELTKVKPELIIVSPFTRTLQTAHIVFCGRGVPFLVHELCRERWGKYTCDKLRPKAEIVSDMAPVYAETGDNIDFDSFGYVFGSVIVILYIVPLIRSTRERRSANTAKTIYSLFFTIYFMLL